MKCPACAVPLVANRVVDISIDFCSTCQGIWFDAGELSQYQSALSLSDAGEPGAEGTFKPDPRAAARSCPRCEIATLRTGAFAGYDLSQCQRCRGVFVPASTLHAFGYREQMTMKDHAIDAAAEGVLDALFEFVVEVISSAGDGI